MNQPPAGLLERLSPRPVCPLVRLGRSTPLSDQPAGSTDDIYTAELYTYETGRYKQQSLDYQEKSEHSLISQRFYQQHSYLQTEGPCSSQSPRATNYQKQNSLDLSSLSLGTSYWDHENYSKIETSQSDSSHEYFNMTPKLHHSETNYLLDNFTKLGKNSPNLDQGYHTLVSPSPGSTTPNLWTDGHIYKGKRYQMKNNSFDRLSDELVIRIFSFLPSSDLSVCARVCRRFDNLAWKPCLWRTILLSGESLSGDKAIRGVLRQLCGQGTTGACPGVEKVHLIDGAKITDKGLLLLARRCPELTHLQIQGCPAVSNNAIYEIVTRCSNLQHLDITGCVQLSCLTPISGPDPPKRLQLQYLDFTDCPSLQDNGLRIIVRNCPQLAYLYLRRCIQITDAGLKFVPSFCSGLRELSVSDCSNITDFGLYELAKLGAILRYLSVAKCDQVSDAGLKVVARRCYKLRYLNARGCEAVSDDAITVLARSCTRLRALDIGKCDVSDAGLRALAESCPNLKKLSLRNCDLVTDRGVQCIAYYCRGLQQLNIQDCQISLEGYRAVKKYCKRCVIEHTNPGFF
ncbi:PREDICTED: F-box/LRR-repeat protein 7 [Nicrophorus vespilloides]|uniref:F-box/LRR-repeat protein 7 n=1 Tax=Nicrophorus vespilloides TaxID=110193 RepID=A0ABM1NBS4_NICVS|nr:PREDICTED: F-box/LRR-repeat protein 7 [Nicrophorus vespilloides]